MEETKGDASESEDVPSDFFDDFNKDEFMAGLQVIDSWDEDKKPTMSRIDMEAVDRVKDLRELIRTEEKLDEYIKPGSRRDPNKTKEAIKRDKEVKVKEYLAKSLDATDELKPPGTEMDDFFEASKNPKQPVDEPPPKKKRTRSKERRSPVRHQRRSPRRSPTRRSPGRRSPGRRSAGRRSPTRRSPARRSPARRSPARRSPTRHSPTRRSPTRRSPRNVHHHHQERWSPRRVSPHQLRYQLVKPGWHSLMNRHSPHRSARRRYSRSPSPRRYSRRSRSASPRSRERDSFLYPRDPYPDYLQPHLLDIPEPQYLPPHPGAMPGYPYPQIPQEFPPGYTGPPFDFVTPGQPMPLGAPMGTIPFPNSAPVPQPVPAPMMNPGPPMMNPVPPVMVPAPSQVPLPEKLPQMPKDVTKPFDALAQLVAEGKITQEDYLKLAPTKVTSMDNNKRVMVLNRCTIALSKLGNLMLPNRLMMNNTLVGREPKLLVPKYSSPLKRQGAVDFHFTKMSGRATEQQNKQLVNSIISCLGLDKMVTRPKIKVPKDMKDAACQTTKPYCDVCEVRESVRSADAGTGIDAEHFCATVHTQVVEQDLMNSKAVFAPSGSIADGAPISIAHMTPAQLVSQLAARAKTLQQTDPMPPNNQYMRRNPSYDSNSYDQQYQNNYNYRY